MRVLVWAPWDSSPNLQQSHPLLEERNNSQGDSGELRLSVRPRAFASLRAVLNEGSSPSSTRETVGRETPASSASFS